MDKLSPRQAAAYRKACGYFAGDLQALTGELKMSNLTGVELKQAARYVTQDFSAWEPTLTAPQRSQLADAAAILTRQESQAGAGSVSSQQLGTLETQLHAPPFSSLSRTIATICRHAPAGR